MIFRINSFSPHFQILFITFLEFQFFSYFLLLTNCHLSWFYLMKHFLEKFLDGFVFHSNCKKKFILFVIILLKIKERLRLILITCFRILSNYSYSFKSLLISNFSENLLLILKFIFLFLQKNSHFFPILCWYYLSFSSVCFYSQILWISCNFFFYYFFLFFELNSLKILTFFPFLGNSYVFLRKIILFLFWNCRSRNFKFLFHFYQCLKMNFSLKLF